VRYLHAFAFSMAAALVPPSAVWAFRSRVRFRDWFGRTLMQLGNWIYKRGVALIPSWRERAEAGMEE